jgi:hypothetical protein
VLAGCPSPADAPARSCRPLAERRRRQAALHSHRHRQPPMGGAQAQDEPGLLPAGGPQAASASRPRPGRLTHMKLECQIRQHVAAPGYHQLMDRNSGDCLDIAGGSLRIQYTTNGAPNSLWWPISLGGGHWQFINMNSGLCMDVSGASTSKGTDVNQLVLQVASRGYHSPPGSRRWNVSWAAGCRQPPSLTAFPRQQKPAGIPAAGLRSTCRCIAGPSGSRRPA